MRGRLFFLLILTFSLLSLLAGCGGATGLLADDNPVTVAGSAGVSGFAGTSAAGATAVGGTDAGGTVNAGGAGGAEEATLVSVAVTPVIGSAAVGTRLLLQATGTYSDNSTEDVTATATWASKDPKVASVAGGVVTGVAPGTTSITATLDGFSGTATITVPVATVTGLTVTPATASTAVQGTAAFQAVVSLSDGSTQDVTDTATWASSDAMVASVSSTGIATGVAAGTANITASVGKISGSAKLTVTAATLVSIAVTPTNPSLGVGVTQQFVATGSFSDGSVSDVSSSATFTSSKPDVATLDAGHVAKTLSAGTTTITAAIGKISGSTTLTVTSATLTSIEVTPATNTLAIKGTVPLVATGTYSDNSKVDLTSSVTWSSSNAAIAAVSNAAGSKGVTTGVAAGSVTITATLGNISGSAAVTVTAAKLVSISVTPQNPSLPLGTTTGLKATGTYSDNSSVDITTLVTWSSETPTVASVNNATGKRGVVTALQLGTSVVHAKLDGVDGTTTVTVTAAKLVSITITPQNPSVAAGNGVALTATANYSDNTSVDVTATAVWSSSATGVATVSNAAGSQGQVTTIAEGTATISAKFNGVTGSTVVTVSAPTLTQVVISPIADSIRVGDTVNYIATAIYSNNTQQRITQGITWNSSDTGVATIAARGGRGGPGGMGGGGAQATGVGAGTTTISATYQGMKGTTTLTVTDATVVSIEVTPVLPTITVGQTQQLTATAIYSDNTTQDVTAQATWVSSDMSIAQVTTAGGGGPGGGGPGGGGRGRVTGIAAGSATISATLNGLTGSTTVTVSAATLTSIQITPFSPTLPVGFTANLQATGIYSDNTTRDLTRQATWTSDAPAVAAVSTANGSRGQLTPISAGKATITATYQGVSGTDVVTVTSATLSSIVVTPVTASIAVKGTQPFVATGTLSDKSTLDVTQYVTWLSTTPSVASISNAAGSRGVATGLSVGSVTITAVRGAVSGKATLAVQ